MGVLKNYEMSSEQYKKMELAKEDYMVNALKLKEELESKNKDDSAVLSDDEDDDDEAEATDKPEPDTKPDVEMTDAQEGDSTEKLESASNASDENDALGKIASAQENVASVKQSNGQDVKPDVNDSTSK